MAFANKVTEWAKDLSNVNVNIIFHKLYVPSGTVNWKYLELRYCK